MAYTAVAAVVAHTVVAGGVAHTTVAAFNVHMAVAVERVWLIWQYQVSSQHLWKTRNKALCLGKL